MSTNHRSEMFMRLALCLITLIVTCSLASAATYKPMAPGHYVYAAGNSFATGNITAYLNASASDGSPVFRGVQQTYYWKDLETSKNQYDFDQIDADIATINSLGRGQKLIIQFSYKSFTSGQYKFPTYIHNNGEGVYGNPANGGTGNGYYVTDTGSHYPYIWNTAVQARFHAMYQALANHLDSNVTLQCVNNSETASGNAPVADSTYGDAIKTILIDTKSCFPNTYVIQYANGPKSQLTKWADACIANNVGWGGPDIRPTDIINNPGQEGFLVGSNNSPGTYAFYWNYWNFSNVNGHTIGNNCIKGAAVQSPDYDWAAGLSQNYTNATVALHVNYMFWRYNNTHESDIINFVRGKVNTHGIAGGLNTTKPNDTTPPGNVSITQSEPGDGQVQLGWSNPSNLDYAGVQICRSTSGWPAQGSGVVHTSPKTETSWLDNYGGGGLTNGKTYYYMFYAYDDQVPPNFNTVGTGVAETPNADIVETFDSEALYDGYLQESGENSGVGGTFNASLSNNAALRAGDNSGDCGMRGLVSFNTSSLPDSCTIVSATLQLTSGGYVGTNPFSVPGTWGNCWIDIKNGPYGALALEAADYQDSAGSLNVGSMSSVSTDGAISTGGINSTGLTKINKTGRTQLRIHFNAANNNNGIADNARFYSGDNTTASKRPKLIITYR